jgi:hypothetical protein
MEKEFEFKVTEKEVNLIFQALAELPFKLSVEIINKLQKQVNDQLTF